MKKSFLFKWVSVLGAVLLLASAVLPGINAYAYSGDTWTWDYVSDENSWNNSYSNWALKVYYANNPSEDLWNANANPARKCNFNDQIYTAKICGDSTCLNPTDANLTTTWGETYQTVNDWSNSYLLTMSAEVAGNDIYELYTPGTTCSIPDGAPDGAYFPNSRNAFDTCKYAVKFPVKETGKCLNELPDGAPDGASIPSWALNIAGNTTTNPDWPTNDGKCLYEVKITPQPAKYVKLLSSKYSDDCQPSYLGWIANLANAGADKQAPWISIAFKQEFNWTIKFNYTDYENGADVYPRGEHARTWWPDWKARAIASLPGEFQWITNFDSGKFTATLVEPIAQITKDNTTTKYVTLESAIAAATEWDTVEIIKAWTYKLPNKWSQLSILNNITIEWNEDVILDFSDNSWRLTSDQDTTMVAILNWAIFSGITLKFPEGGVWRYYSFADWWDLVFNNCHIKWWYNSKSNVTFDGCTFEDETITTWKSPYAITTMAWDLIVKNCTFNKRGRFINAFQPVDSADNVVRYTITVKDSKFNNLYPSSSKPAVVIKEWFGNSKETSTTIVPLQYDVNISWVTFVWWKFPGEDQLWAWYYAIDYMLTWATTEWTNLICYWGKCIVNGEAGKDDVSYWTSNWNDVVVTLNWSKVYSTPKRDDNWIVKYSVTFDWANATEVEHGSKVAKPTDPTKSCYRFDEWQLNGVAYDFNSVVTSDLALTSKWTYTCSSSWGGGGSSKTATKTTETNTWLVNNATWTNESLTGDNNTEENNNEEDNTPMTLWEAIALFWDEQIDAYQWALENGITTMDTVEKARLDQPLTRAELAKMMVVYMQKVLKANPVVTWEVKYLDVDESLWDLAWYIQLAYQYQIMGINADGTSLENFNPNGVVTRWEYATVFSRVLFGSAFNKEWADFYTNHLEALKEAWILKDTTPTMQEIRWWVMLMMYRSSQNTEKIEEVAAAAEKASVAPAEEAAVAPAEEAAAAPEASN